MSRGGKKTQPNPYKWCKTTIAKMLEQQEYCGDIINFKSYSKSFRNKTRVENPKENWAIFKDVHEPIIDRETWERVQELTKNSKRRKPKNENVKKSIFTNLLYCGDCGRKLWFNINKQNPSIRFYSCSNYKGLRGTCESTHYVREDSLEQVVKMELFKFATVSAISTIKKIADTSCGLTSTNRIRAFAFTVAPTTRGFAAPVSQLITSEKIPWSKW